MVIVWRRRGEGRVDVVGLETKPGSCAINQLRILPATQDHIKPQLRGHFVDTYSVFRLAI